MLLSALKTGKKLRTAWRRIPMILAGEKSESRAEPMASLIETCRRVEGHRGIQAASFLLGFPWADEEHNGAAALVTSLGGDAEFAEAEGIARDLAAAFWERRRDFRFSGEAYPPAEALGAAYRGVLEQGEAPVFVSDSGDNPTAGAAGDATDLLERILETLDTADRLPTPLLYSGFYDAPAVRACMAADTSNATAGSAATGRAAKPGAEAEITLGGNWDTLNGRKIPLRVGVEKVTRGYGPFQADLALVSYRNLRIVLTSRHIGFGDAKLLPALGVNAGDYCLVAVKLGYLEPCFRDIAARAILATTRGCSNEILESIPYTRLRRPLYPLDPGMEWVI
jgi:microcystin degradation protein MlrC